MNYILLPQEQRYQIYAQLKTSHFQTEIAEVIEAHKSTISGELSHNRRLKGYRRKQAHEFTLLCQCLLDGAGVPFNPSDKR